MSDRHAAEIPLLQEKLRSADEEERRLAVLALASFPFEAVRKELFQALGDDSWRVRKESVDALLAQNLPTSAIEELIELLRSHDNAGLRNSSVEVFVRLGGRSVPCLMAHVRDNDHDVRKFVLDILGDIGGPSSVPVLIDALADEDPNVCAAAAENLGKIADPRGVQPLLHSLEKPDIWLRFTILEALGKIGRPLPLSSIAPLVSENLLKKPLYDCLGATGGAESVDLLVDGLKEKVKSAREAAATSLVKLRERISPEVASRTVDARLHELNGSPYIDGLLVLLESADRGVREAVVKILGIIGDERATNALLHGCRDDRLRRHCLVAFRNIGDKCAATLVGKFSSADEDERCFITWLCGELCYKGSSATLREAMHDSLPMLRKGGAQAAGKIGLVELLPEIAGLLDDTDPDVREGAIEALTRLAEQERSSITEIAQRLATSDLQEKRRDAAILYGALRDHERLSLLLKDEDPEVRKAAISSLADMKLPSSVNHLVMALVDEDPDVRIVAANALGAIGGEEVIEPLLLALKDEDPWVKCAAIKGLARLADERAWNGIDSMFADEAGLVVISALEALYDRQGEHARQAAMKALVHPDEEVIKTAIQLLSSNGDEWIDDCREQLLAHPHWDVRRSFVVAMAEAWGAKAVPYLTHALEGEGDELVRSQIKEILDRIQ